jgi:hypothetical protein
MANILCYDIETGPLPDENLQPGFEDIQQEIDQKYASLILDEFDPSSVKYGNRKTPKSRQVKLDEAIASYDKKQARVVSDMTKERDEAWGKLTGKAALSPTTGQVLQCSFMELNPDGMPTPWNLHQRIDMDEAALIHEVWTALESRRANGFVLVGFNNHGFDNPFLVNRSRILDVVLPDWLQDFRGYWDPNFIDMMKVWHHGQKGFIKLAKLCELVGIPGKMPDVDGGDFAKLFNGTPEERKLAQDYCAIEMAAMWGLAIKLQLT